jgi:hypothetical protein
MEKSHFPWTNFWGAGHQEGEESSSRKLVHIEGQSFRGWCCSECAWMFHPYDPPVGKSLDEMKQNFQMQLSEEFGSHACAENPKVKVAKFSA